MIACIVLAAASVVALGALGEGAQATVDSTWAASLGGGRIVAVTGCGDVRCAEVRGAGFSARAELPEASTAGVGDAVRVGEAGRRVVLVGADRVAGVSMALACALIALLALAGRRQAWRWGTLAAATPITALLAAAAGLAGVPALVVAALACIPLSLAWALALGLSARGALTGLAGVPAVALAAAGAVELAELTGNYAGRAPGTSPLLAQASDLSAVQAAAIALGASAFLPLLGDQIAGAASGLREQLQAGREGHVRIAVAAPALGALALATPATLLVATGGGGALEAALSAPALAVPVVTACAVVVAAALALPCVTLTETALRRWGTA